MGKWINVWNDISVQAQENSYPQIDIPLSHLAEFLVHSLGAQDTRLSTHICISMLLSSLLLPPVSSSVQAQANSDGCRSLICQAVAPERELGDSIRTQEQEGNSQLPSHLPWEPAWHSRLKEGEAGGVGHGCRAAQEGVRPISPCLLPCTAGLGQHSDGYLLLGPCMALENTEDRG